MLQLKIKKTKTIDLKYQDDQKLRANYVDNSLYSVTS